MIFTRALWHSWFNASGNWLASGRRLRPTQYEPLLYTTAQQTQRAQGRSWTDHSEPHKPAKTRYANALLTSGWTTDICPPCQRRTMGGPGASITSACPRHPLSSLVAGCLWKSTKSPWWKPKCLVATLVFEHSWRWAASWTMAPTPISRTLQWCWEWPGTPPDESSS